MLRYMTDRARPGLVALYDIRPGNGAGLFLQPRSPHGANTGSVVFVVCSSQTRPRPEAAALPSFGAFRYLLHPLMRNDQTGRGM